MRFGLGQINPTVGDIGGNAAKIIDLAKRAMDQGCAAVAFPELALIGYPPKDLLLRADFIERQIEALDRVAAETDGVDVIVGYAERNDAPVGRPLHNAAALLRGGSIVSRHFKTLLPTYDVFDESRYFEPGPNDRRNNIVSVCREAGGEECVATGVSICEDLWNDERLIPRRLYHENPFGDLHAAGAKLLVNCSASPFVAGKHRFRRELFATQARHYGVPLLYVNQVGGNDELVFDGNSCAFDAEGNIIAHAKAFEEDLLVVDVPVGWASAHHSETPDGGLKPTLREASDIGDIREALVLGTRDYLHKCGFKKAVIGLSGGIDSAVTAAVAVEALGQENVVGIAMPSRYSSEGSVTDAQALADNLGITIAHRPDQADARRLSGERPERRHRHRRADGGEPASPHPRGDADGVLEQDRGVAPDDRQQERAGRRVLPPSTATCAAAWRSSAMCPRPTSTASPATLTRPPGGS